MPSMRRQSRRRAPARRASASPPVARDVGIGGLAHHLYSRRDRGAFRTSFASREVVDEHHADHCGLSCLLRGCGRGARDFKSLRRRSGPVRPRIVWPRGRGTTTKGAPWATRWGCRSRRASRRRRGARQHAHDDVRELGERRIARVRPPLASRTPSMLAAISVTTSGGATRRIRPAFSPRKSTVGVDHVARPRPPRRCSARASMNALSSSTNETTSVSAFSALFRRMFRFLLQEDLADHVADLLGLEGLGQGTRTRRAARAPLDPVFAPVARHESRPASWAERALTGHGLHHLDPVHPGHVDVRRRTTSIHWLARMARASVPLPASWESP